MDFSKFQAVESSNTRKAGTKIVKEQSFKDMKYRRATTEKGLIDAKFYVSNDRFAEFNLQSTLDDKGAVTSTGNGIRLFIAPDGDTILGIVANDDAKILKASKRGEKTKNFKSTILENALAKLGVISLDKVGENQFLDFEPMGENVEIHKIKVLKAFKLKVGQAKKVEKAAEAKAATATTAPTASAPAAPVASTAPAPQATAPAAAPAVTAAEENW